MFTPRSSIENVPETARGMIGRPRRWVRFIGIAAIAASSAVVSSPAAASGPVASATVAPTDAILGWMLGAEFPDLSPYAETWASTAFPNRCIMVSPLPCP